VEAEEVLVEAVVDLAEEEVAVSEEGEEELSVVVEEALGPVSQFTIRPVVAAIFPAQAEDSQVVRVLANLQLALVAERL